MIEGLDSGVYLEPVKHQYFDRVGIEYLSTSKFISLFYKSFDSDVIAGYTAIGEGCSKQEVLDRWKAQADEGTRRHNAIELFFKTATIRVEDEDLRPMILNVVLQYKDYYRVYNEVVLSDNDELLAGTSDLILVTSSNKNSVIDIGDFKNYGKGINQKEVDKHGKPRNEYMIGPLSHLQNSSYNKLCLQLSDYAYKLEKKTGRKIGKLFGHWISPENPLINYQIPCFYLKYEIIEMIQWRKENAVPIDVPPVKKSVLNNFGNESFLEEM